MATIPSQSPDRSTEEQPADIHNMKEQSLSVKSETSVAHNFSKDAVTIDHAGDAAAAAESRSFSLGSDYTGYSRSLYTPQPQAQPYYYKGYENSMGDEYSRYFSAEGFDIGSPGVYNDNPSLIFHTGYNYNPQMPYGPYSPVTSPLPSIGGDAQLYPLQQCQFSGPPSYQQHASPNMAYINSPGPISQPELTKFGGFDQHGDHVLFRSRSNFPPPVGSFSRGSFHGNTMQFPDSQQGFDGTRSRGLWSDYSKPFDRQRPLPPVSPVVSPRTITPRCSFGQNAALGSQQRKSFYGLGSRSNAYKRGYVRSGFSQGSPFGNTSFSSLEMNNQCWLSLDNCSRHGRNNASSVCGCSTLDILSEQNRGPRASKINTQITVDRNFPIDNNTLNKSPLEMHDKSYNRPEFVMDYNDAKFFIIKSYSEDNVHKSIKYGVWASTPSGNKKLNTAFRESKEKQNPYPVFLFFSVNASAQFCGVAEMIGPVDFDKSVDYWQQDKWSGQFPVKWHIIKDVPNSQLRHIILENNDHRPVTNSRDIQEVKLVQGMEMLTIFKNYETEMSILDDFDFYEVRQKAMQERKVRQTGLIPATVAGENNHRNNVTLSTDFIKQMSKSFAEVVRVDDATKEGIVVDRAKSVSDGSLGVRMKIGDAVSSAQAS